MTLHGETGAAPSREGGIAENLALVRDRIARAATRAGRDPADVHLIAVSKTKPPAAVREAFRAGQRVFGENRVQEALDKMDAAGAGPVWHLIGHLQSNKARFVPGRFAMVHTVDSEKLARALERHMAAAMEEAGGTGQPLAPLEVLIQLNLQEEDTKAGITGEDALRGLAETIAGCPHLRLAGLMTIPQAGMDEARTRALYARIRGLHDGLRSRLGLGADFRELSMGMSHDFEWAVAEGATLVRVGTAIFGARPETP